MTFFAKKIYKKDRPHLKIEFFIKPKLSLRCCGCQCDAKGGADLPADTFRTQPKNTELKLYLVVVAVVAVSMKERPSVSVCQVERENYEENTTTNCPPQSTMSVNASSIFFFFIFLLSLIINHRTNADGTIRIGNVTCAFLYLY